MKIYGSYNSSAGRCYVMLEECGVSYERLPLNMKEGQHKSPEFLKLNPNGKIPTLVDGDFTLWESLAINRYLAAKYKPEMLGNNQREQALVEQWSVWSLVELQPPLVDILIQMHFVPEPKRDQSLIQRSHEKYPRFLKVLDAHLAGRDYMVGSSYTLADLNVASTVNVAFGVGVDLAAYPNILNWVKKMQKRPAFQKVAELAKAAH
jgi:glutathione S-transferase